jgi:exodeoxyribonuclease VII small subunit
MEHFNFEKALEDLNQIVTRMEQGGLSLEESLLQFERGIRLTRECQEALKQADQRIQILIEKNGELKLDDYRIEE